MISVLFPEGSCTVQAVNKRSSLLPPWHRCSIEFYLFEHESVYLSLSFIRTKASSLETGLWRKRPLTAEVTVIEPGFFYSADGHAEVFGFYHHDHSFGSQLLHNHIGDLTG